MVAALPIAVEAVGSARRTYLVVAGLNFAAMAFWSAYTYNTRIPKLTDVVMLGTVVS